MNEAASGPTLSDSLDFRQFTVLPIHLVPREIAQREDVTQRYIAHLLKLAWLAPDVIQAINGGTFPAHLTLARLKKDLPLDWEAQRKAFGLTAQTR